MSVSLKDMGGVLEGRNLWIAPSYCLYFSRSHGIDPSL